MDADRFDDLIRALTGRRSRRRFAATAAALVGGLLAAPPFDGAYDALAKNKNKKGKGKKKNKKPAPCPKGQYKCGPNCIDTGFCCEDGAAKIPDCGETCCQPDEECCGGTCYNILTLPLDCDACQEIECASGQGFTCVQRTPGIACGEECCPEGQECCAENGCYDPETQCCGVGGNVGVPCGGDCCVSAAPYKQTCCASSVHPSDVCWGLLSPCAACEYFCRGNLCCRLDQTCCLASGSKPDRCIPSGENCDA